MGRPDVDRIRDEAHERIAARPNMVLDGEPIEELARAHERHATRLDEIVDELANIGTNNYLGDTSEGRAATENIHIAVNTHDRSVANTIREQARQARVIASALRQIDRDIRSTESENQAAINRGAQ